MSTLDRLRHIVREAEAAITDVQDLEAQASLAATIRTLADPAELERLAVCIWPEGGAIAGASSPEDAERRGWIGPDGTTEKARAAVRVLLERLATELDLLS